MKLFSGRAYRVISIQGGRQTPFASVRQLSSIRRSPPFGFAFDIDGVLLRSSKPISGAIQALNYLQANDIPFILLTNGGGKHESHRIDDLNSKLLLNQPLKVSHLVQSHTPFARYVHPTLQHPDGLRDKPILICGGDGDHARHTAQHYGFKSVILPGDIFAHDPAIWPFSRNFTDYHASYAKPLPCSPEDLKIHAIFVYNDPRDWGLDIQLISDLLLSRQGYLGTYSAKNNDRSLPNNGYLQDGQPPIYFSNADLLWAAAYHLNRLGQGGFQAALEGVWNALTGGEREGAKLHRTVIGKPFGETYEFAETRLVDNLRGNGVVIEGGKGLKKIYMIGDNPESDIRGANTFESTRGIEWVSLLTRSGVYQDREGRSPSWAPRVIVDTVYDAVRYALEDSGWHERMHMDHNNQ